MKEIISLNDVTFGYEKETVLEHLNMTIREGDFVGIMGVNGAGKSTLIKLILGQLEPWNGEVYLYGKQAARQNLRSQIGYVPQKSRGQSAGFAARAEEIVMLNLYSEIGFLKFPQKKHRKMVCDALKMVEMEEYKQRLIYKMSGGQQQRVMIAKALVNNPKVLLFDEPTTGVDNKSTHQLMHLLQHLNKCHGITVVIISHDVSILKSTATRLFRLENKKVEEQIGE